MTAKRFSNLALAAAITAAWAASVALQPQAPFAGLSGALDLLRLVTWYLFILHLYRRTVRARQPARRSARAPARVGRAL